MIKCVRETHDTESSFLFSFSSPAHVCVSGDRLTFTVCRMSRRAPSHIKLQISQTLFTLYPWYFRLSSSSSLYTYQQSLFIICLLLYTIKKVNKGVFWIIQSLHCWSKWTHTFFCIKSMDPFEPMMYGLGSPKRPTQSIQCKSKWTHTFLCKPGFFFFI